MKLDIFTLLVLLMVACFIASVTFFIAWSRRRSQVFLGLASSGFFISGVGYVLIILRGRIPDVLSIDIANFLIIFAFGFAWNAFRHLRDRRSYWSPVLLPGLIWLGLCQVPEFYGSFGWRTAYVSVTYSFFSVFYAVEFFYNEVVFRPARRLLSVLAGLNAAIFLIRAVYALSVPQSGLFNSDGWLAFFLFVPLLFIVTMAFVFFWLWQVRIVGILQHEVEIDPLTGILNRRAFEGNASQVLSEGLAKQEPVSLLLIDIDHFKAINDRLGHLAGDRALSAFAQAISAQLRKSDVFARYGGEEFVVLLRGTETQDAVQVAEKLRAAVSALSILWEEEQIRLTVSIGVATVGPDCRTLYQLIDRADHGLYDAKGEGRNRVVVASPS